MADDLLNYVDNEEQRRVGVKLAAQAAALRESVAMEVDERVKVDAAKFTRETSDRMIRAEWKRLKLDPVVSAGVLISPTLVAFGERCVSDMNRHVARRAQEPKD